MARNPLAHACLLATMLVAGAMPTEALGPSTVDELAPYGPTCVKSGDDSGMGGSHVSCKYSCIANALVSISVEASDQDASTYGNTKCGDAVAKCNLQAPSCTGVSDRLTTYDQPKASCHGHTDEVIDSPVTVACASSGDARGLICQALKDVCEGGEGPGVPSGPPSVPDLPSKPSLTFAKALVACALDSLDGGALLAQGLASTGLASFDSFVVYAEDSDGSYAMEWDGVDCLYVKS